MNHSEIIKNLNKKIYHPIYFLMGEEAYYIDLISDYIEKNVLTESEKAFNLTIVYGKDATFNNMMTIVRRFPMMASHQVVIIKEAQYFDEIAEFFEKYLENIVPSTILVACHKYSSPDKRKKWVKAIENVGVVMDSPKIYESDLITWINSYCSENGYKIDPRSTAMLAEYLGADISKVSNELDKLMILIPKEQTITPADIEKNIGISKDYNIFELQKAIGDKNVLKVNMIINYYCQNLKNNPIPKTIGSLFPYFTKLLKAHLMSDKTKNGVVKTIGVSPYFADDYLRAMKNYNPAKLVQIISLLREFDLKSKGVESGNSSQEDLYKELFFKILH